MKTLKGIGYWTETDGDGLPDARLAPARYSPDLRNKITRYLERGHVLTTESGFSWCRFQCGIPKESMGDRTLTDGTWAWPEGFAHYVSVHEIPVPPAFLEHLNRVQFQLSRPPNTGNLSPIVDIDVWKQWAASVPRRDA